MQEKTVLVSGKEVRFRSSAAIPRLYRIKFKRDIFKDLSKLEASYKGKSDDGEELQIEDLEIFENVAYIMAFHADPTIPGTRRTLSLKKTQSQRPGNNDAAFPATMPGDRAVHDGPRSPDHRYGP